MLEGLYRILVVGRDENDVRRLAIFGQPLGQAQPGQAGHLDIEEDDVGRELVDQAQRIEAVGGLGDDAQLGPGACQLGLQVVQQLRFVVGDQGAGLVDGRFPVSGSRIRSVMPQG